MNVYAGTFLIAFSTLALEVTLSRLLSVITWYHLAFFAVSTAMLGMTAGAVTVYLRPLWFTDAKLPGTVAKSCLWYSLSLPVSLVLLCLLPLTFSPSIMSLAALLVATALCSLPFFFSGIVVSAVLTKCQRPVSLLYGSDLIGASLGCLFVLGMLSLIDAASVVLLCGSIGAAAALCFAWRAPLVRVRRLCVFLFILLTLLGFCNSATIYGIRPFFAKDAIQNPKDFLLERWNSFSRIIVYKGIKDTPQLWGPSPAAPQKDSLFQYHMNIDGAAATVVRKFSCVADIDHLRYDVTSMAYYLRPKGGACIIGVGGGRDLQSALLFGHEKVVGIDVNPIFIDLLSQRFRGFAGIADHNGVTLVCDEARSYLSRNSVSYSLIQMSLIDTWASTGAGAFSLSENALYTVEAWQVFLSRLSENGIFTVSRWYNTENLGETGRIVSLAVASLLRAGVADPSRHIAMVTSSRISTLLLSKSPLSDTDIATLQKISSDLQFNPVIVPGVRPRNEALADIVSARSFDGLEKAIENKPFNYRPTTDENPYFFNMLRLDRLTAAFSMNPGVVRGNLLATIVLLGLIFSLLFLTVVTIIIPLVIGPRPIPGAQKPGKILWSAALYFSLIGAGFMSIEIALIQRLSVFLGHPVYALGILLFTIIASTGVGSLISGRLPLPRSGRIVAYPLLAAAAILCERYILSLLISGMIASPILHRIAASILAIFPLGMIMGIFFPTGMKIVASVATSQTPWYWALNGVFGVLFSACAVFFSIYFGISTNFYIGALCYAAVALCMFTMQRSEARGHPLHSA
jgi:spermidine synthase